jgi:predicted RNase H-like HicB family nuclease/transcriptional regulator with XRE-family HTH domain
MARLRQRLGRILRMLRDMGLQVSQETFANSIEMDPSFLGEVERAEPNWSIDTLELIAAGFGMPASELVRAAEAAPEEPGDDPAPRPPPPGSMRGRRRGQTAGYSRRAEREPSSAPGDSNGLAKEPTLRPAAGLPRTVSVLVVVERTADGFSAHPPDLPGCVASAASRELVERQVRAAIAAHFEQLRLAGAPPPASRSYATVIELPF